MASKSSTKSSSCCTYRAKGAQAASSSSLASASLKRSHTARLQA
eukprot:CAMPEP_0181532950 /NCGR_PEP_ID=MMETSP1110-20121109/72891_1 /TAXON_ID=174948 /ORGANISM="Symbiodinium sp., Strain CCMP421" /LENGTH=43 /DNA_ID= /DNA_START= /DNA_END= /DNA_ORIENTATION=